MKIDGDEAFDEASAENELKKLEEKRKQIAEIKKKLADIQNIQNDDQYMGTVLRELVTKGMTMLESLQHEIEEAPRGRDVETAAAMMSAINGVVDNINKIKIYNAKIKIEEQKLELKKSAGNIGAVTANQNILMVGSTNELMDLLLKKEIIPDNNKLKEVKVDKISTTHDDDMKV